MAVDVNVQVSLCQMEIARYLPKVCVSTAIVFEFSKTISGAQAHPSYPQLLVYNFAI